MVLELELRLGLGGCLPCGSRMRVWQKELVPRYGLRLRVEGKSANRISSETVMRLWGNIAGKQRTVNRDLGEEE